MIIIYFRYVWEQIFLCAYYLIFVKVERAHRILLIRGIQILVHWIWSEIIRISSILHNRKFINRSWSLWSGQLSRHGAVKNCWCFLFTNSLWSLGQCLVVTQRNILARCRRVLFLRRFDLAEFAYNGCALKSFVCTTGSVSWLWGTSVGSAKLRTHFIV